MLCIHVAFYVAQRSHCPLYIEAQAFASNPRLAPQATSAGVAGVFLCEAAKLGRRLRGSARASGKQGARALPFEDASVEAINR